MEPLAKKECRFRLCLQTELERRGCLGMWMHAAPLFGLAAVPPSKRSERLVGERVLGRPRDSLDAAVRSVLPSTNKAKLRSRRRADGSYLNKLGTPQKKSRPGSAEAT